MIILGLNVYHGDSSACVIRDGVLVAAIEEERFRRIKHWAGFPSQAIRFCLSEAGVELAQVDHIAVSRDPRANYWRKVAHALTHPNQYGAFASRLLNLKKVANLSVQFEREFGADAASVQCKMVSVEHHMSHMASAFFASPFEEAAILSIDGFGDFSSTMLAHGRGGTIQVLDRVNFPHSCGIFYTAFTQLLGFPHYGDEYKLMGLAPYGQPVHYEKLRDVVELKADGTFALNNRYFVHADRGVHMTWDGGAPFIDKLYSIHMSNAFGPVRQPDEPLTQAHKDLAASVQKLCEEVIFNAMNHLHRVTGSENICVAGGVAQNSVANGKISRRTRFKKTYLPMAGHDAGTSIGAALYVYNSILSKPRCAPVYCAYTGSRFTNEEIETVLQRQGVCYERIDDQKKLYEAAVDCMVNAGVVGWFQGRAEFGPRALGARSIICDPTRLDAKELINTKIKRRESFRPFAPSILEEYVGQYFEIDESSPFMEKVLPIREDKRTVIPAVTHVDGTGRLQTVSQNITPKYYHLIDTFRQRTGVPLILNTSFNENEPIVNSPQEALDCYLRTDMDMLVLENCVVRRH